MNTPNRRSAFTVIELLVVMAVIGILVALLLPAVQVTREAARRMSCKNQLKQMVLAMHNYHDTHGTLPLNYGTFPPGYDGTPYPADEARSSASWIQMLLPYIEQQTLYSRIRFDRPLSEPENRDVAETSITTLRCPSDTSQGVMDNRDNIAGQWGITNYKACLGSNWAFGSYAGTVTLSGRNSGNPEGLDHCTGVICRNAALDVTINPHIVTRMHDVTDGTATTIAIGEAVPEWCRHTWWWSFNGSTATAAIPLNYYRKPDDIVEPSGDWLNNYGFNSRHPGGANLAMMDGSVQFVSETIDLTVYRALGSIQGGEVVGEF